MSDSPTALRITPSSPARRAWWALATVAGAQLMLVLDLTILNIAMPSMQHDLAFGDAVRPWLITAYALAFGSLLLLGGRLCDLFGRRRTILAGLLGFAIASVVGGVGASFAALVTARALQGVCAALIAPAALSTIASEFAESADRSRAFGAFSAVSAGGGIVGLLLGGVLTQHASWRWCFFANVVLSVIAMIAAWFVIDQGRAEVRPRLDVVGTVLGAGGLFSVILGFSLAETTGWISLATDSSLIGGVALLALFVWVETRVQQPLLPMSILGNRHRVAAFVSLALVAASNFAVFLFLTYFFQHGHGLSPVGASLAFLPMLVAIIAGTSTGESLLLRRFGPRVVLTFGLVLIGAGLLGLGMLSVGSTYAGGVLPYLPVLGYGLGSTFVAAVSMATQGVAIGDEGVSSAAVHTSHEVGASVGVALLSTVAATVTAQTAPRSDLTDFARELRGYSVAFAVAGGLALAGAALVTILTRRSRLPPSVTPVPAVDATPASAVP